MLKGSFAATSYHQHPQTLFTLVEKVKEQEKLKNKEWRMWATEEQW